MRRSGGLDVATQGSSGTHPRSATNALMYYRRRDDEGKRHDDAYGD